MALDILVVDDERDIRELVAGVLSDEGYECRTAGDSQSALDMIDERRPSLVLLDVWLHGSPMDGLEVLDAIKVREPDLPVIIFSGHGNIDTAVSAVSRGAMDFIEKPFEAERLLGEILQLRPRDAEARLMLATLLRHNRRYGEALEQLSRLELLEDARTWRREIHVERQSIDVAIAAGARTSSKSRSRRNGCCIWSAAPPKRNACGGRMPGCGAASPMPGNSMEILPRSIRFAPL